MLRPLLAVCLLVAIVVVMMSKLRNPTQEQRTFPQDVEETEFAGSQACASCHTEEFESWSRSAHGRHATPRAEPEGGAHLAIGSQWMQAYMRRDLSGFHRILPQCYDLRTDTWRPVDDVLIEIRGRPQPEHAGRSMDMHTASRSFELDCSGCHASGAHLRYRRGRMDARWRTAAIDCESCHGPGRAHVEAWRRLDDSEPMPRIEQLSGVARTGVCARCHGGPPAVGSFGPHDAKHYVSRTRGLAGIYSSGAAAGQSYQAHGFRRSPCHLVGGLACSDCHDAHGPGLRSAGHIDAMCTNCHGAQAGVDHTHHDMRQEGARCVSCHMPRLLDGVMAHQRDHRIGSPRPHAPEAPDACTACHADQDKAWASHWVETWWGPPAEADLAAIRGVHLSRSGQRAAAEPLLEAALDHDDPFFRWTAIERLPRPERGVDDPSPEVRIAAVYAAETGRRIGVLRALRSDDHPVVRALAYGALVNLGRPDGPPPMTDLLITARQSRNLGTIRKELAAEWLDADRDAEAVHVLEQVVTLESIGSDGLLLLAAALHEVGDEEEARATLQGLQRGAGRLATHVRATVHALVGRSRWRVAHKVLLVGQRYASSAQDRRRIADMAAKMHRSPSGVER